MKIILTGFEPFGKLTTNPTMEIIAKSAKWNIDNVELNTFILPVVYDECASILIDKIKEMKPDYVISLGVAVGRGAITLERIGINIQDTVGEGELGDNLGEQPKDKLIDQNGPDGLFSTLPIRKMTDVLIKEGIPAQISNTAGTYICNNTLYSVLNVINNEKLSVKAGFIHVPASPNMVVKKPQIPSMSIELQEKAVKRLVEYCSEV
ncbi:pyroglutamyl-peptidase I [Evansella cellulosilytica]|uniref:Pyroglutamyl-peptidase I n=1 Tax=Evansella cellulosilytica (strain ATCC 21833 / DSM 2522 / FERM P-1141 / JCM 9156 / N-4) TaxID=649639 RepID=E6TY21_EVAC2|nr:pyroglutamyl-peptidase I [Evansella cellulosilytica]ADU31234.1 Pyroglutamyl-peptidase I [Evansella cellulosilytica DSM 2522]